MQVIYKRLEADLASEPAAYDLRARRWLSQHPPSKEADSDAAASAAYTDALSATQGPQMYDLYLAFLKERLGAWAVANGVDEHGPSFKLSGQGKSIAKQMLQVRL